ncbi:hypothetical protein AYO38_04280 [bacterium SCGC AG-212-C10]|nr:hypothetical protein AYO38_04280 [bacterium SCGC AG-212-C10]
MSDTEVAPHDQAADGRLEAADLARRAAARDTEAWSAIFEAHYQRIYIFVRYRLRGADAAEDIASQVFEIAYSRAEHFDFRGVPIEAWLIGIARNLVRDHIKKAIRRGIDSDIAATSGPAEADPAPAVDLHQDLERAMHFLTEDQQTVLSLRFLLDRSVLETAELMERSEDAVKNLQRRALAAMRRALSEPQTSGAHLP